MIVTRATQIEDLLDAYPQAVSYFIRHRVSPFSCAGAFPKPLGEMLEARQIEDIDGFISGLNAFIAEANQA